MKASPRVSVLTPIYNTNPVFLRECIESILNQTFTDFEFLILNDSPENKELAKIVKSYKDGRIKYYENDSNIGISASRNKLLGLARGEYIAVFDHDDISLPDRIQKEVEYLDNNKDVGVVSSNVDIFTKGIITDFPTDNREIKIGLMNTNVIAHTALMMRHQLLRDNDICYESEYSPAEDYKLILTLMDFTLFHNIPEPLVKYRVMPTNTTHTQRDKMTNADLKCRDFAAKNYPYLATQKLHRDSHQWIKLFDLLPVIRVSEKANKTVWDLFGIVPLLSKRK